MDVHRHLEKFVVVSFHQGGCNCHMANTKRPVYSGNVQVMVVEEVDFKWVIIEWIPVSEVKKIISVP